MTPIRSFMTADHRHCDNLFAAAEEAMAKGDLGAGKIAFEQFREALQNHFSAEEKTLFPSFEVKTGMTMGPTRVMRMEHEQMRILLDEAAKALERGDGDDYLGQAETLLIMMQQHNLKEENMLYPMCDEHLAAEASAVLAHLETDLSSAT
ncbi:MAG: hemerythrin domain-containing protein [Betaproteobacteria bacterium]|nr:hemerythrin domain-containing protein [Betaproteobacteria bacterium]MCL2887060.1 hemerythrin domain-containing protein [Betaproteobacteria bacterium]